MSGWLALGGGWRLPGWQSPATLGGAKDWPPGVVMPKALSYLLACMALLGGCGPLIADTKHQVAGFDRDGVYRDCEVRLGWTYQELTAACGRPYRAATGPKAGTVVLVYRTFATSMAPTKFLALQLDQDPGGPRRVVSSRPLVDLPADVSLSQ